MERRAIFQVLVLIFSCLVSVGAYAWWTEQEPDRYNWFDFFRSKPIPEAPVSNPAATVDPSLPIPNPAPDPATAPPGAALSPANSSSAALGTRLPNGALLAQTGPATTPAPAAKTPRARPVDTTRAGEVDAANVQLLEQVNRAMADLTDAVVPAVVSIDTSTTVNVRRYVPVDPFGLFGYQSMNEESRQPGLGSGVFVSNDGYVLTNHHVIAGVDEILITTHEGEKFEAEWVGSDPSVDIAVLKLKDARERAFPHLKFADSDGARVGEMVLAVGNPFGLTESVTRGIISAKQRRLSDGANEYFQTDTVINPGNSGGPLVNVRGEIVGINVALFTGQANVQVWQGIGLAVPSNEARSVYEAIAFGKPLLRGYLGIELSDVNAYLARLLGLRTVSGAVIVDVQDESPASEIGLKAGDVILKFAGEPASDAETVMHRLRRMKAGTPVDLEIFRDEKLQTLSTRVIEKPDEAALSMKGDAAASGQTLAKSLGIEVRDLTAAEREALGIDASFPAIVINAVEANSQGARRFRAGDLIHGINRDPVKSVASFYEILGELPANQSAVLILSRRGQRYHVQLRPTA